MAGALGQTPHFDLVTPLEVDHHVSPDADASSNGDDGLHPIVAGIQFLICEMHTWLQLILGLTVLHCLVLSTDSQHGVECVD